MQLSRSMEGSLFVKLTLIIGLTCKYINPTTIAISNNHVRLCFNHFDLATQPLKYSFNFTLPHTEVRPSPLEAEVRFSLNELVILQLGWAYKYACNHSHSI